MTIVPNVTYVRLPGDTWWYAPGRDPLPSFVAPGALTIGTASYDIPATNVTYVSSAFGSDSASGAVDRPVKTLQHALDIVPAGGTVVMRAGTYHENVSCSKNVTIQNYPGEAVWMDGTSVLTGFTNVSGKWRAPYTVTLDRSPTSDRGVDDNPTPGWGYINPSFPYAAWPDQVWVDGVRLQQVGALADVTAGKFYVEGTYSGGTSTPSASGTSRYRFTPTYLYLANDPSGSQVRVSDLNQAVTATGVTTMRGIGVRRYATSVCDFGMVRLYKEGSVMENCVISESATYGMSMIRANSTVRHVSVQNNGFTGMHANQADNLLIENNVFDGNNRENFNYAPAAAGVKITRLRGVTFRGNIASNNHASGIWCDESVYNIKAYGNAVFGNAKHGFIAELSGTAVFANNFVYSNGAIGGYFINCDHPRVWNNTFLDNGETDLNFNADDRAPMQSNSVGRDPRQSYPDPAGMDWLIDSIENSNNAFSHAGSTGTGMLVVRDSTTGWTRTAASFGYTGNGNVYNRRSGTSRMWGFPSATTGANTVSYFNMPSWQTATGKEAQSIFVDGSNALKADHSLTSATVAAAHPQTIPTDIATLIGHTTPQVGAWIGDFLWLS